MRSFTRITLYLIVVLLLQELLFRMLFPLPQIDNLNRAKYMPGVFLKGSKEIRPYSKWIWSSYPDTLHDFVHSLNGYGFRDDEWDVAKGDDEVRVMVIGDSFVEGVMAEQDQTIPKVLQSKSDDRMKFLNVGILGVGMEEYIQVVTDLIPVFNPDEVILVLYANDISGRPLVIPETSSDTRFNSVFLPRIVLLCYRLLEDRPLPMKWRSPQPFIPAVPDRGNIWTENENLYSPRVSEQIAEFMRAGKFNAFRTNWVLKEEMNLKRAYSIKEHLAYLKGFVEANGSKLSVVYIPSRHQVSTHYYQFELEMCQMECPPMLNMTTNEFQIHRAILSKDCFDLGIPLIDTYRIVKDHEDSGHHLYWNYDDHMRAQGYEIIASHISENLLNGRFIQ